MKTFINKLAAAEGQQATLQGWVSNSRDSKGLVFIVLRDGTGFCQCVINQEVVGNEAFEAAKRLGGGKSMGQQSSIVTQREAAKPAPAATPNAAAPQAPAAPAAAPSRFGGMGGMLGGWLMILYWRGKLPLGRRR